jgi:hypothetical protein
MRRVLLLLKVEEFVVGWFHSLLLRAVIVIVEE